MDLEDEISFKDQLLDDTDTTEIEYFNCCEIFDIITNAIYTFSVDKNEIGDETK